MASRWSEYPCGHFFPVDDDPNECVCGWTDGEHDAPRRNGAVKSKGTDAMSETELGYHSKLDMLMEAVTQLVDQVQALQETQAELIEKLANQSLAGVDYNIDYDNYDDERDFDS